MPWNVLTPKTFKPWTNPVKSAAISTYKHQKAQTRKPQNTDLNVLRGKRRKEVKVLPQWEHCRENGGGRGSVMKASLHFNDHKWVFKVRLDGVLSNLLRWEMSLPMVGGWSGWSSSVPFSPNHSVTLRTAPRMTSDHYEWKVTLPKAGTP